MKKFLNLNDYEMVTGYNYLYFSLNEFINHYKKYYVNTRQKLINEKLIDIKQNAIVEKSIVKSKWMDEIYTTNVIIMQLTFNDVFKHFISWFLYDLKIGKNEKISLIKYDDKIVIYTKNNKYEYYTFFDFN